MVKYICVTGGVLSGLGKGIIASSVGLILKDIGFTVTTIKMDPYLNIDCGTMSPYEHGEVFVLKDGTEVDLDLGNYERFIGNHLSHENNITTGKIYQSVINKERKGNFLGKTVQVVPHITNEIIEWIIRVGENADICIIELGGTVGDIESMAFVEALRQLQLRVGVKNFMNIHVSLVPIIMGEQKSKPTQHTVRLIKSLGINPDIIVLRCEKPIEEKIKTKISMFCFSDREKKENIISSHNVKNVLEVPVLLLQQRIDDIILLRFGFTSFQIKVKVKEQLSEWKKMLSKMEKIEGGTKDKLVVSIIGKYTGSTECYFSVLKAIGHSCVQCGVGMDLKYIESQDLVDEKHENWKIVKSSHCAVIPGGFGVRGIEGKIRALKFLRENNKPTLGICLGFQCMAIEFARNVLGLKDANSSEFDKVTKNRVVTFMPEMSKKMGGTMRLGEKKSVFFKKDCQAFDLYGKKESILERHRHRYEINGKVYRKKFEEKGFNFVACDEKKERMEICELDAKKFYIGCQFHPEFTSSPLKPNPLFLRLIQHGVENLRSKK